MPEQATVEAPVENDQIFVIGVGASAGGLEAIRELLKDVPRDLAAAYVIVQHMSPKHRSLLTQLIDRETHLDVVEINANIKPKPNMVYVTPPRHDVMFMDGCVTLVPSVEGTIGPAPSVDRFFTSLARELGPKAVGIVLSGTGSDGSYGVRAIREAGGITIAQDDKTAKYDGMPTSAVETGCVDLIMSPHEIGVRLASLSSLPSRLAEFLHEEISDEPLTEILDILRARTGVDFRDYKPTTVRRRLQRRMLALEIEEQADYAAHCRLNPGEIDALLKDLLISVTRFFRDTEEFLALRHFIKEIVDRKLNEPIRVWNGACATGEEAYSVAMLLAEACGGLDALADRQIQIFATDLDESALRIGRRGKYPLTALNDVPADLARKYFKTEDDGTTVVEAIRNLVVFSVHNIFEDPPFLNVDLMCCRNLLIYFGSSLQERTLSNLHYALKDDGILFLGKADTTSAAEDLFTSAKRDAKIYRPRSIDLNSSRARTINQRYNGGSRSHTLRTQSNTTTRPDTIINAIVKSMVKTLGPDAILMTDDLRFIRVFGDVNRYVRLADGAVPTMDYALIREPLANDVRVQTTIARRNNTVQNGFPHFLDDDPGYATQIDVYPLQHDELSEPLFLVTFMRSEVGDESQVATSPEERTERIKQRTTLERELETTREALNLTIDELERSNEELQSANEEMQGNNEELQAMNEELETSNEELQSTNEELVTINEELQITTTELTEANSQMEAVLDGMETPMLIINKALHVVKFSEQAGRLFGLTQFASPHLSQLALPAGFPVLATIADAVLRNREPFSTEFSVTKARFNALRCASFADKRGQVLGVTFIFYCYSEGGELQYIND